MMIAGRCGTINLKKLLQIISYQENLDTEGFVLKETMDEQQKTGKEDQGQAAADNKQKTGEEEQKTGADVRKEDGKVEQQAGKDGQKQVSGGGDEGAAGQNNKRRSRRSFRKPVPSSGTSAQKDAGDGRISASLEENRRVIARLYGLPENKDVIIRDFTINTVPPVRSFAVFIDGLTDKIIQDLLFQALMAFAGQASPPGGEKLVDLVKDRLLPGNQIMVTASFREFLDGVNYGGTALFLEGCGKVLLVETKGWEHRTVDRPQSEQTVNGPQEAFTETLRTNTALLRKLLKSEQLSTELLTVGSRIKTFVAVMYLRDLANPALVDEVKRRIEGIKVDYLADSGILEQFIEDHPYNLNPTVLATERPDRVASKLLKGK